MSAIHDQELADTLEDLDMRGRFVTTEREQRLRIQVATLSRQLRRSRARVRLLEGEARAPALLTKAQAGSCILCGFPANGRLCHAHSDLAAAARRPKRAA